jgi:hypothetical protein
MGGYKQALYKVITPIPTNKLKRLNKSKKWAYGYDKDSDVVIISKTGQIGEVYEIFAYEGQTEGLKVALPPVPKNIVNAKEKKAEQRWTSHEEPKELKRINSIFEWERQPEEFKEKWFGYIDEQFEKREKGDWFMNNGKPTYITGSHWTYLQHSKIDVGKADFRESNRIFYIFWEACKADFRCYGMNYLKNRRSGFSFMASGEVTNLGTQLSDSRIGILSKTGADAKKMFTDKVVPISINYPFYFKPIQDGMDRPKTELAYRVPATKLTKKGITSKVLSYEEEMMANMEGLDTTIDWKNTGDNSYDGEKLKLLVHDESGKWEKPNNILNNWRVTKTCLRLGSRIIGKCMMGSTSNALDKGGNNYKKIFDSSDVTKRNRNGQTSSGLYSLFIPMEWNFEGFIDSYGMPVFNTPEEPVLALDGTYIEIGALEHWENECDGLKDDADALNEFIRQYPKYIEHAFRDESKNSLFNITKLYEQIDYNEGTKHNGLVTTGSFQWENGVKDTRVIFTPNPRGRFKISWTPDTHLQNNVVIKNGIKYPGNEHMGAFGCDSYDISGTVAGVGSNGALHGLTKYSMENAPPHTFFLEYVSRPPTADIFFEDILMAIVFYGMPILAENNKPRLLYHIKKRGYRGFSMNRPDKVWNKLSVTEKEIGGVPNSGEQIKQDHAAAIESYIDKHIGHLGEGNYGNMYFQRTLQDWVKFDINKRTDYDASISSGLAIMACNRNLYKPSNTIKRAPVKLGFSKYNQSGSHSSIIKNN